MAVLNLGASVPPPEMVGRPLLNILMLSLYYNHGSLKSGCLGTPARDGVGRPFKRQLLPRQVFASGGLYDGVPRYTVSPYGGWGLHWCLAFVQREGCH